MLREVAVAALRVATGLHSFARLVKSEAKHVVPLAANGSQTLQEPAGGSPCLEDVSTSLPDV